MWSGISLKRWHWPRLRTVSISPTLLCLLLHWRPEVEKGETRTSLWEMTSFAQTLIVADVDTQRTSASKKVEEKRAWLLIGGQKERENRIVLTLSWRALPKAMNLKITLCSAIMSQMIQLPLYAPQILALKPTLSQITLGQSSILVPVITFHQIALNSWTMRKLTKPEPIRAADGQTFSMLSKGNLLMELPNGDQKPTLITLKNAYYSPYMAFTLISVSCIDWAGFSLLIKGGTCVIQSLKSNVIGCIPLVRGLYRLSDSPTSTHTHVASTAIKQILISELHQWMGHMNHEALWHMVDGGMVTRVNLNMSLRPEFCPACIKAKATRKHFSKESQTEYKSYGDKFVSDVWGPAPVQSIRGNHYYNLYKDQSSHEEVMYLHEGQVRSVL